MANCVRQHSTIHPTAVSRRPTVHIVPSVVGGVHLPAQAALARAAGLRRHAAVHGRLLVEDGLDQRKPLGVLLGGVRVAVLGGDHGGNSPEGLVIVTHRGRPVARVVVAVVARLEEHGLGNDVVEVLVARVVTVVDQRPPHGATLPPVVIAVRGRTGQDTGYPARLVAVVEGEEVGRDIFGGRLDGCCAGDQYAAVTARWRDDGARPR